MDILLRTVFVSLLCVYGSNGFEPERRVSTYFLGGRFVGKGVSVDHCVRYCLKLGTCWAVDYFQYGGHCSIHMDDAICTPDNSRYFKGAEHFRLRECEREPERSVEDRQEDDRSFRETSHERRDNRIEPGKKQRYLEKEEHLERLEREAEEKRLQEREEEDNQLADFRASLDARQYTHDCFMHIYEKSYAKGGYLVNKTLSMTECAQACADDDYCVSLNYEMEHKYCIFFSTNFNVSELITNYCCHHVAISCHNENRFHVSTTQAPIMTSPTTAPPLPTTTVPNVPSASSTFIPGSTTAFPNVAGSTQAPSGDFGQPTAASESPQPGAITSDPPNPFTRPTTVESTGGITTESLINIPPAAMPTGIAGVCPFQEQKGTSRKNGLIRDDMASINTLDGCRYYCTKMNENSATPTCHSFDWDKINKHCFVFDTEDRPDEMVYNSLHVDHYVYYPCEDMPSPIGRCIVHGVVNATQDAVVVGPLSNIPHTVTECDTFCYYKYSFETDGDTVSNMLERGCAPRSDDAVYQRWRQCVQPEATAYMVSTMCHCIGDLCNNVGYAGYFQLYAYYPLDLSCDDQSGHNRHGRIDGDLIYTVTDKRTPISSAFFNGNTFVFVPGMQMIHISDVLPGGDVQVSSAFTFWMKRLEGENTTMFILSNNGRKGPASLEVYSDVDEGNNTHHEIAVRITFGNNNRTVKSAPIKTGVWQFVAMNIANGADPEMYLYIGDRTSGLGFPELVDSVVLPDESKSINPSNNGLTIGKQGGDALLYPYIGFLDDIHFYQGQLTEADILAIMLKYNYN